MKKPCLAVMLGLTLALAAGCSTAPVAQEPAASALDLDRMALIEAVAHTRGVRVIWVNAPKRDTAAL